MPTRYFTEGLRDLAIDRDGCRDHLEVAVEAHGRIARPDARRDLWAVGKRLPYQFSTNVVGREPVVDESGDVGLVLVRVLGLDPDEIDDQRDDFVSIDPMQFRLPPGSVVSWPQIVRFTAPGASNEAASVTNMGTTVTQAILKPLQDGASVRVGDRQEENRFVTGRVVASNRGTVSDSYGLVSGPGLFGG